MEKNSIFIYLVAIIILAGLFVFSTYIVQENFYFLEGLIESTGIWGMVYYVLIIVIAAVAAPISIIPFVPIASSQWGWIIVGFLTLLGETIGAMIAFFIARKFGYPVVRRLSSLKEIHKFEKVMPEKHSFFGVILLRIFLPFDFISYAIGLISTIGWKKYLIATIIGLVPYSFTVAYLGKLPFIHLINATLIVLIAISLIIIFSISRSKSKDKFYAWWKNHFREKISQTE